MLRIRRADTRPRTRLGWLDSRHGFSFGGHFDPDWTGFRDLLVLNEDRVAPGAGFGRHPHRDMEIVSLVLQGALAHRDDLGHGSLLRPGEVQRMSAGTGIVHAEMNASEREPVHFLQIWLRPDRAGLAPSWEQRESAELPVRDGFRLLVSGDPGDGAATWHGDATLAGTRLAAGEKARWPLAPGRHGWVQVAAGRVTLDAGGAVAAGPDRDAAPITLAAGDGVGVSGSRALELVAAEDAHVLVFDLP